MKLIFKQIAVTLCIISSSAQAQVIFKSSIDNGGASTESTDGTQILYTIGEVNMQELSAASLKVSEGFIGPAFKVQVSPKILLQGPILNPLTTGLMNDQLRQNGFLPTTSPYQDQASANVSVFSATGANAIVDWVWVELRDASNRSKLINARSALLQRDGDVVDLDGNTILSMYAAPTNYYVVVNHRNHLGAMSQPSFPLKEKETTVVDFSGAQFSTFGNHAQAILNNGNKALWAGDTAGNNFVRFSGANNNANVIKDYILDDASNGFNSVTFSSTGYLNIDVNLDGVGRFSGAGNDSNILKDNVLQFPGNAFGSATFTINPTVPNTN